MYPLFIHISMRKLTIGFPFLRENIGPKIFLRRLKNSINEQRIANTSIFINPLNDINIFSSVARNYYNKPYLLRLDGIYHDKLQKLGKNEELNNPIFDSIANASALVFQSHFSKALVEHFYGEIKTPYKIIFNGAPTDKSSNNYRRELKLPYEKKIILSAASWRRWKRLDEIIETVNMLNKIKDEYILVILGEKLNEKRLVNKNYIYHEGSITPERLYKYYKSADLFLHLAWIDNCPNTVVEAIANGLPVICTNQGGTKELVKKANAGIVSDVDYDVPIGLVDLYNPPQIDLENIVKDIFLLFENYEEIKRMIDFDVVDIKQKSKMYINIINEILENS